MPVLNLERFTFDRLRQKYRDEDGRTLGDDELKRLILLFLALYRRDFENWSRQLVAGELSLGDWQRRMIGGIRKMHVAVAAAAVGGTEALAAEPRFLALLGARLRTQLTYLDSFARKIEARLPFANTEKSIVARAASYAAAPNQTFEEERRVSHEIAGFTEERNILAPAEHCGECLIVTAAGWQPIGSLPPPGTRQCRANCKCRLTYRRTNEREDEP